MNTRTKIVPKSRVLVIGNQFEFTIWVKEKCKAHRIIYKAQYCIYESEYIHAGVGGEIYLILYGREEKE